MPRLTWTPRHGLATREHGGGRETILHIHGLGESGLSLEGLALHPILAGFRHLIPDLPGYGRTPPDPRPVGLEAVADRLAAWLDRMEVSRAVVVGHSMGGVIGTFLAERHPSRVRVLINVEGNLSPDDCTGSARAAAMPVEEWVDVEHRRFLDALHAAGRDDRAHRGYFASCSFADPATFHRHAQELVEVSAKETLAGQMARLWCPTAYVAGVPGGAGTRSHRLLAQAGVPTLDIPDAGHWPFLDHPERVARVIADVVARADADPVTGPHAERPGSST